MRGSPASLTSPLPGVLSQVSHSTDAFGKGLLWLGVNEGPLLPHEHGKSWACQGHSVGISAPSTLAPSALGSFMGAAAGWALQKCWSPHLCSCRCWKTKIEELPARCRLFASGMTTEDGFWSRFLTASITNTLTPNKESETILSSYDETL